jgi:uncharacterized membrane protein
MVRTQEYENRHGRRGGRGWRPWALLPKVCLVGLFAGGLAAAALIWLAGDFAALAPDDPRRAWLIEAVALLMRWLVVPALVGAMLLGVLLLLQHPRVLLKLRWLQVKLVLVAVLVPAAHLYCASRLAVLREAVLHEAAADAAARQLSLALLLSLAGALLIIILARHKPRLGQNWARAYPAAAAGDAER